MTSARIPIPPFIRMNLCSENFKLWRHWWLTEFGAEALPPTNEEKMDEIAEWFFDWRDNLSMTAHTAIMRNLNVNKEV